MILSALEKKIDKRSENDNQPAILDDLAPKTAIEKADRQHAGNNSDLCYACPHTFHKIIKLKLH